jgi:predicted transcriptional regulator of viral defense system
MTLQTPQPAYGETSGLRILQALADQGKFIFNIDDARTAAIVLGIAPGYMDNLVPYLVNGGWLLRLRRGLYAGTGRLPGHLDIPSFAIATHVVTPAAISHWSALHHHGLTEQVPQMITAVTTRKVVTPSMRGKNNRMSGEHHAWIIQGVRYEFITIKSDYFFGIEEIWIDEHFRIPITDRERTVLDLFAMPRIFGGLGEALGILETHLHEIDILKLVQYALRYNVAAAAKRLGWALDYMKVESEITRPLQELPISGYRLLDPTRPARGSCDKRWMIQNNLEGTT